MSYGYANEILFLLALLAITYHFNLSYLDHFIMHGL